MASDGAVVVLVKTPGLTPIQPNLSEKIGRTKTEQYYVQSCRAIEGVLKTGQKELGIVPYWAVAEAQGVHYPLWSEFAKLTQPQGEVGSRLFDVYRELCKKHSFVIILEGDSPQISLKILDEAVKSLRTKEPRFVIGPTEEGSFYLMGGNEKVPESVWSSVSYSQWDTADQLHQQVSKIAVVKKLERLFKVDTQEELSRLRKIMERQGCLYPAQTRLVKWLKENGF